MGIWLQWWSYSTNHNIICIYWIDFSIPICSTLCYGYIEYKSVMIQLCFLLMYNFHAIFFSLCCICAVSHLVWFGWLNGNWLLFLSLWFSYDFPLSNRVYAVIIAGYHMNLCRCFIRSICAGGCTPSWYDSKILWGVPQSDNYHVVQKQRLHSRQTQNTKCGPLWE